MAQDIAPKPSVALIVGVTGMVGLSLAETLKKPTALGGPWKVYGIARRPKPDWLPSSFLDGYLSLDALNSDDTHHNLSPISNKITHIFWVGLQVGRNEQVNITLNSAMLSNILNVLKSAKPSRLKHITLQTGTKHYMGPIFDPVLGAQLVHHDPPYSEDMPRLPYPNFYYALEDLLVSEPFTYSVHRSSIIIGASLRSTHNMLLRLAVYATICRYQGLPFTYPGNRYTWEHFCDFSDARLIAEQHLWAAVTSVAKNQAFNCTNGDVFTWKSLWKVLCEIFYVEYVPFDETKEFDLVEMMKDKGQVWDEIVQKNELYKTKFEDIGSFAAAKTILHFEFQHVSSMNKSRDFGFFGYADTFRSVRIWVQRLRQMKIIP